MPTSARDDLAQLDAELLRQLEGYGFDAALFERFAERLRSGDVDNRVRGIVEAPDASEIPSMPEAGSDEYARLERLGRQALARGECALVVLAGGMATRMGGVVKALVEAAEGKSFLELRIAEVEALGKSAGNQPPLWLMTSHATERAITEALGPRLDGERFGVFRQGLSLRLTPEARLYRGKDGAPSEYSPGHGDLPAALQSSGLLQRFVARGGRYVMIANVDNLGATLEPAVIGFHLDRDNTLTCEVVDKVGNDRGGIPARLDGRVVVLEEFRLPESFDAATVRVFNTNTFHFDASALRDLQVPFTYFVVNKKAEGNAVIQFERLLGEVTSHVPTGFLRVPRDGAASRFLPCKDNEELEQRRQEIVQVLRARGVIS
jgi:UTP--glucose-1-phosphate uridylyltransferase